MHSLAVLVATRRRFSHAIAICGGCDKFKATIRLAHKSSGHIFEYLWCERPPYLRNAVVRPAPACAVAATHVAPAAAKTALLQLRSARLVAA